MFGYGAVTRGDESAGGGSNKKRIRGDIVEKRVGRNKCPGRYGGWSCMKEGLEAGLLIDYVQNFVVPLFFVVAPSFPL